MSELRKTIKDLCNVAKTLDAAEFHFEINALTKLVAEIALDRPPKPPVSVLKKLLVKYLRGEEDFSMREISNLPFIIYEPALSLVSVKKILSMLDFSRATHLSRIVRIYLECYDNSPKTEFLRHELNNLDSVNLPMFDKIFSARDKLFGDERLLNMANLFAQKLSIADALAELGLKKSYNSSKFILTSLENFFNQFSPSIADRFKILTELDEEFDAYQTIFPAIADSLIKNVERVGTPSYKKKCLDIFYRRLGDPRFGNGRFKWNEVSQASRKIFSYWLATEGIEIPSEFIPQA